MTDTRIPRPVNQQQNGVLISGRGFASSDQRDALSVALVLGQDVTGALHA